MNGAPGTGKTYLAKEIAEEMGAKVKMVQFHPSYDYTDFVEGLRPIKDGRGNIGFERKDGVFKEFCKAALQVEFTEYGKSEVTPKQYHLDNERIENALKLFRDNMDGRTIPSFRDSSNKFGIKIEGNNIYVIPAIYLGKEIANDKKKFVSIPAIKKFIETGVYNKFSMSYEPSVGQYIKDHYLQDAPYVGNVSYDNSVLDDKSPYVFIIDEINRGEISKIFGELFFSIDPGYRGEKGKVQTQYQNLVEDGDVFKDGFFVPENVYIIGTMNDIDRSVESMDFAMRRRFAWHEVTAEESAKNMGLNEELTLRMSRLNEVISNTEGLGSAYHVGGSFFLKVQNGEMTVDSLWNLNLKSLMKEYLRGLPDADEALESMEDAYFLKGQESVGDNEE